MTTLEEFLQTYSRLIKKRAACAARQLARDAMWSYEDLHQAALAYLSLRFERIDWTKEKGQTTVWVDVVLRNFFHELREKDQTRLKVEAGMPLDFFERDAVCRRPPRADFLADLRAALQSVRAECDAVEGRIFDHWIEQGHCAVAELADALDLSFWVALKKARSLKARLARVVKDDPYLPSGPEDTFDDAKGYTG